MTYKKKNQVRKALNKHDCHVVKSVMDSACFPSSNKAGHFSGHCRPKSCQAEGVLDSRLVREFDAYLTGWG